MENKHFIKRILTICFVGLFMFVCLSFSFPLSLASEYNKDTQTSVNDIIMFASASEDTGASSAPSSEKGGCYYLGAGTYMKFTDGKITGTSKKYGGAVFISDGATFTMSDATITGCSARYGGAIYVASGGTFEMCSGATIELCSATYAPAVYVEDGATVIIDGKIINCYYNENFGSSMRDRISTDTIMVGHSEKGVKMHYIEHGTYPQSFVGESMNSTLEKWYSSTNPSAEKSYQIGVYIPVTFYAYKYTDGNYYVRGVERVAFSSEYYIFSDGTEIQGGKDYDFIPVWYKVEPIKWIVLNYDDVQSGKATTIDCISEVGLASYVPVTAKGGTDNAWSTSYVRTWLNEVFLNQAFTTVDKEFIVTKTILNNVTGDIKDSTSDGKGVTTQDKLYCLSYYEANSLYFASESQLLCSPTDFVIETEACQKTNNPTRLFPNGGTGLWYLRSSGLNSSSICVVDSDGLINTEYPVYNVDVCVRPAISFNI